MEKGKPKRPPELAGFSEQLLARLWRSRAARAGVLRSEDGGLLRVIYPGRPSSAAGPDFRDALLYVEGVGLTRGDVELHIKQGDWRAHGHHRDHRYNSVALHVVYTTEDVPTALANGAVAPVVSAKPLLEAPSTGRPPEYLWRLLGMCGYAQPSTLDEVGELLDRAGDARFEEKIDTFHGLLSREGPEQALYATIMEGLGYSRNRAPFAELAYRLPVAELRARAMATPPPGRRCAIEGWLLQAAGLDSLDSPPGQQALPAQESFEQPLSYRREPVSGVFPEAVAPPQANPLPEGEGSCEHLVLRDGIEDREASEDRESDDVTPLRWHLFRVRPVNHPKRRLKGAAYLLERYLDIGLDAGLGRLVGEGASALRRGLEAHEEGRALIGSDRARELVVNAVLPFCVAWGRLRPGAALAEAATALYHRSPKTSSNEIHREMVDLLIPAHWHTTVNGARRQQGLLHLQRLLVRSDFGKRS